MIKLYTKTVCPQCLFIKSNLVNSELEFELLNIDTDIEAKNVLVENGFMSVPIMEIDGEFISDVKLMPGKIAELSE